MDHDRPVLTGLLALGGVGLVVGLLLSGAALAGTQVLGLGDDGGGGTGQASARESMYLPTPSPTPDDTAPLVTLAPEGASFTPAAPTAPVSPTAPATPTITLQASATQVSPGERIDLTGVYPGGEGATLAVERNVGGTWSSFVDVTATVSGGTFATYIRTSQSGANTFRVRDVASGLTSNEVTFTIG